MAISPGSVVIHPEKGQGQVLRVVRGGRYLMVRFSEADQPWQVRLDEVQVPAVAGEETPPAKPALGCPRCLQTLEAFRLGVVPVEGPLQITVGREYELELVKEDLESLAQHGTARVFLGDYGTGKTHLLECIEALALQQNMLVSRVVLDRDEVPASHPKRVYRELATRLTYPDGEGRGLAPLFERVTNLKGFQHSYLSPVLAFYKALSSEPDGELRSQLLDWIEGQSALPNYELEQMLRQRTRLRHRLYALMDYRPWAHLYSYLVGGLAVLARKAGYQGLVLLFDEAEFYSLLNNASREFADLLFGYYAAASLGPQNVQFDMERAKRGGQAVHRSFPPIFLENQPLYCVFAMTEDPWGVGALKRIVGDARMERLTPLTLENYQQLCRKVVDLYLEAYPDFSVGTTVQNPMGQVVYRGVERMVLGNPRQVLKFVMEMLDFSRLRRDQVDDFVREVLNVLR